jgi:Rrf2 family protein
MQLSAKTQYACLAALELARRHENPSPVCLKTIADEQNISAQFLVQILLQLKRTGLVRSIRGAGGGYRLAMDPDEISLLQIIEAMEGTAVDRPATNATPVAQVFFNCWDSLTEENRQRLADLTLAKMCSAIESVEADMYYI